jgi:hypothetical protein
MDRRTIIVVSLLAGLLGAAVAMLASGPRPETMDGARPAAPDEMPSPSGQPSPVRTAGTATSTRLVEDFDMLPTGGDVPEWISSDDITLDVAAVPTAVDRSARLTAQGRGSACRPVAAGIDRLTADFMFEPLPTDSLTVLAIEFADGSVVALSVSAEGTQLKAGEWYRWSVSRTRGSLELALFDVDGTELGAAEAGAPSADAEQFCIATESPTRVYLDSLTVEGH